MTVPALFPPCLVPPCRWLIPGEVVLAVLIAPGCVAQGRPDRAPGVLRERAGVMSERIVQLLRRPSSLYIPLKIGQERQCVPFRLQRQQQQLDPEPLAAQQYVLIRDRPTKDGSRLRYQITAFEPAKLEIAGPWFERPDGSSGRATCAAEFFVVRIDRQQIVLVPSFASALADDDPATAEIWFFDRRRCIEQLPRARLASFCE